MIDIYNTRSMLAALRQLKRARRFFLDTFFSSIEEHTTEAIDIDVMNGKRRLAPFVSPRIQGKVVEKTGFRTYSYKPAYVKPKMVTHAGELMTRGIGQMLYTDENMLMERATTKLAEELAELDDMITRREEWMAAKALVTGQVPIRGEGLDEVVDFGLKTTHNITLTGNNLWSAGSTAKPLTNFRTWKRLMTKDCGLAPTDIVMGSGALDSFLACSEVTGASGLFDLQRVNMGQIDPQALPDGITYYGRMKEVGCDIWTYDEWYVDPDTDTEEPMMPEDRILMIARGARFTRHYGAIQDLDALAPFARFPKVWKEEDPSARYVMVQSAPLPAPHQIDAIVSVKVK